MNEYSSNIAAGINLSVVRQIKALRYRVREWQDRGLCVGLIPTMGALHGGHLSLIERMRHEADRITVSIFVNPKQFGEGEDMGTYPRDNDADLQKLREVGANLAFVPDVDEIYPEGFATEVRISGLTDVLCGKTRPGHFNGITTIVTKLLLQCMPDIAIFGEKDFQQLVVVRKLVKDLDIPVRILSAPIVRDVDGLALSSRNRNLDEEAREKAAALPSIMEDLVSRAAAGEELSKLQRSGKKRLLAAGFDKVDYVQFRSAKTLEQAEVVGEETRLFAAAHIGGTRLIDNWPVSEGETNS